MPTVPPYIIEPIWEQFSDLLPDREPDHPLGYHRPRVPDPVVIEKVVEVLVFGCAYEKIADGSCSATTLRRRGTEWICLGVMEALRQTAPEAYERIVGLEFSDVAVDWAASLRPVEKPSSSTRSCATPPRPWTWTSPTSARRASTPRT